MTFMAKYFKNYKNLLDNQLLFFKKYKLDLEILKGIR
jgi:hypothetical protein